jgi:cyclopropane-fatty-acyl-phospholipid synthase
LHYAKTLEHWLERYEKSEPEVAAMFDTRFARAWRLYLAGSLVGFKVGTLQLFQMVFAGPQCPRLPWTRASLYADQPQKERRAPWTHAMS